MSLPVPIVQVSDEITGVLGPLGENPEEKFMLEVPNASPVSTTLMPAPSADVATDTVPEKVDSAPSWIELGFVEPLLAVKVAGDDSDKLKLTVPVEDPVDVNTNEPPSPASVDKL